MLDKLEQKELGILHLIHSGVNCSRLELAGQTNLSPASITTIVQRLMTKDLVVESEPVRSQLGRRPVPLEIRGDAAYLVGVDIGSFYQRILVTDINGKIVYKSQSQNRDVGGAQARSRKNLSGYPRGHARVPLIARRDQRDRHCPFRSHRQRGRHGALLSAPGDRWRNGRTCP